MEIRLIYTGISDRSVKYKVFVRSNDFDENEYCACEVVYNFNEQRRQKTVMDSACYDLVGYADTNEGIALRLDGMHRRLILPRSALRTEPDEGAYYFYILGDRVKHCINETITKVIRNELINKRKVKISFDYGKQDKASEGD